MVSNRSFVYSLCFPVGELTHVPLVKKVMKKIKRVKIEKTSVAFFSEEMAGASNPVEYGIQCVLCRSTEMKDGEKLFLMDCCKKGIHRSCVRWRFPDYNNGQHIQYCVKVMQKKFVEIHPLFSRIFHKKLLNFRRIFCEVRSKNT